MSYKGLYFEYANVVTSTQEFAVISFCLWVKPFLDLDKIFGKITDISFKYNIDVYKRSFISTNNFLYNKWCLGRRHIISIFEIQTL